MNRAEKPAPFGSTLLGKSAAHPGSIDMSVFQPKSKPAGQGSVSSDYLQKTREDNPEPESQQKSGAGPVLSNCRFVTPVEDLRAQEEFDMAVDVKIPTGSTSTAQATFTLFCYVPKSGTEAGPPNKEERSKTWTVEGKVDTAGSDQVVVKARRTLMAELGTTPGEKTGFELEATHPELKDPCKSGRIEVVLKTQAHWVGGDDMHFRTDGEFPLLGADGALLQVLATAAGRVKKPEQERETVICFGFASSAGDADSNRELSLRRAQVVKALLDRDESSWSTLAKANFETRDIQQFLSDLQASCGWECDPGAVDGQDGPKTKSAIGSFQKECNSRYKLGLKEDGDCGPKTWGAVHRAILGQVQEVLGEDSTKAPSWPKPKWGNGGEGVYGNGEDFATGGDKPDERSVQITFFAPGSEQPLKKPAAGQKSTVKENPVQNEKIVEKKKMEKSGEVKKSEPIEDGVPYFNTTTDELFILPKAKVKDFDREWKMMEMAMPIVGGHFFPDPQTSPEDAHLDLLSTFLFMKKLQEANSIDAAETLAKNAKSEIEAGKKAVRQNPKLAERLEVKGASMDSGWYQKIMIADGKRMVWVRGEKIRSHARWFNRKQAQAQVRKEMESEAAEKKKGSTGKMPATSAELKLFERDFFEPQKGTWLPELEEVFEKHGMQEMLKDSRHFQAGVAAQAMRWAAEGKYGANVNWTKDKTIKAEAKVEGSFSLLSAQGHFDIYLTGKEGIDLIAMIKKVEPTLVRASAKPIKIQANLTFTGCAFTGVCGSASAGIGLAFKEGKKKEAGMEVGVEVFAGAKVGAEAAMALKMQLFDDKNANPGWKDLSSVTYGAWAAYGIGAEASFKMGYYDERFRINARLGLVIKGGVGHYFKAAIHGENVAQLIWTLGHSVNWNEMGKLLGGQVWSYYQMIMWNSALTGKTLSESANLVSRELDKLMLSSTNAAVAGLESVKSVDDTFDRYVPGYTIAKQFSPAFWVTKETYHLLKGYNQELERGAAAIKTVGKIRDWKYVTREYKHNMLVDLCQSGTGWLGPFSGEDKEDAIIKIMDSIRDKAEYDWIMGGLVRREKINLNDHVDFSQQSKLDSINAKFK